MNKYNQFIFKDYTFDVASKKLSLHYSLDDTVKFEETYIFDFEFVANVPHKALDIALQQLFFMAGVSYYKTYLPPKIRIDSSKLDETAAKFYSKTYQRGLGEFFYVNHLNPKGHVEFPISEDSTQPIHVPSNNGLLVGIGGGKDSLVSAELLRSQPNISTWSMDHRAQLEPLVDRIGLPHFWVDREWDKKLLELSKQDAYNGHIPISAIFACVGTIVALLSGHKYSVVSNESSANEPTLQYEGVDINHQYSKSLEFEKDYQQLLARAYGDSIGYFSLLRPLSEVHIAKLFAKVGFEKYHDVFSSCNRAFVHTSDHMSWCGVCSKCAFTFLALTPFIERGKLEAIWGKNLLLDPSLEKTYKQLLGIEGDKPLDCVGEVKESREAMTLAQGIYPELAMYSFELPKDYTYTSLASHSMPNMYYELLTSNIQDA